MDHGNFLFVRLTFVFVSVKNHRKALFNKV